MCGIIGRVGRGDAVEELIHGLESLEYRGYDSAGLAVGTESGVTVCKTAGEVSQLTAELESGTTSGPVGIGHTRWSTHGPPTDANAHPHTGESGTVAVVHNGVVENYQEVKGGLVADGREFTSETDTEVIPHLVEKYLETHSTRGAVQRAVADLEGSYAIAVLVEGEDRIYAARKGSPLVLGISDDAYFLASDVPAFLEYTQEVVYLQDDDMAVIAPDGVDLSTVDGEDVERASQSVEWDPEDAGKGTYDHYMLKEIHTQPNAISNTIQGRVEDGRIRFDEIDPEIFEGVTNVHFVACGTSYHAALYGANLLNDAGINARPFRASEYVRTAGPINGRTLVVAVTQSGETADTLRALEQADERGAPTLGVTNVMGSTVSRKADETTYIRAGPEIGVAATKTFSSQAVTLTLLSQYVAEHLPQGTVRDDLPELLDSLSKLPGEFESVISESDAQALAVELVDEDAYFFIGRGMGHPVAQEGALKFKEITYRHAEGFAAGELKHGPLALVTDETPVFAVLAGSDTEKTVMNAEEAKARGADIVAVGPADHRGADVADYQLTVADTHPIWETLLANIQLQLISYHTAEKLGRAIDKPRNLAKSVTVE
ncbi:glutamine--fructose-6-phosphate transaminase (isomerizing) [Haloarculaceae archaeon H-GB1-1]|nr:glutamine--fructose-6-phosphate transaminase (isomerizing) [Haloarculaceae archaeon H-GB1-1]